jgi:hypothetical protein
VADYGDEDDLLRHGNHTPTAEPLMCLVLIRYPSHWAKGAHFWHYGGRNVIQLYGTLRLRMLYLQ